nr:hypothetical protein [Tanacetum cinerariifolium]
MSSKRNNIKLAIQNDKSEIVCGTCKQCFVAANHDACLLSSVNAFSSRANNLCANVPPTVNQKRPRIEVWKLKQVGFQKRLSDTPKPRLLRFSLKWSPSGCSFDLKGKLVTSKETNCLNDDKAFPSNPQEPIRKRFSNSTVFLGRNDHVAAILGYGDLKWGNITISRVYFVEGLVHTVRTKRPQPKGNTQNDRVPSASKSSEAKKNVIVEDHRRNLSLSKNQKTMSSKRNNIKLAIQNDKSEIVCDGWHNSSIDRGAGPLGLNTGGGPLLF